MGKITLTDDQGRTYTASFDDSTGTFDPTRPFDGVERGLAVSAMQDELNGDSTLCSGDFSWSNWGRDSFHCLQPDRLSGPDGILTAGEGSREVRHVRLHLEKEVRLNPVSVGGVEVGPLTPVTQDVEVTVRWVPGGQHGAIQLLGMRVLETPPPPPPAPAPPGPDLGEAIASAGRGIGNFFSGIGTAISSASTSFAHSLRSYFA
jgi:hypothetical protein